MHREQKGGGLCLRRRCSLLHVSVNDVDAVGVEYFSRAMFGHPEPHEYSTSPGYFFKNGHAKHRVLGSSARTQSTSAMQYEVLGDGDRLLRNFWILPAVSVLFDKLIFLFNNRTMYFSGLQYISRLEMRD